MTAAALVLGACAVEPDGVRWNAPFGNPTAGSVADIDTSSGDDEAPPSPLDSGGDDDQDTAPKPSGDTDEPDVDESEGSSSGAPAPDDTSTGEPVPPADDDGGGGDPGVQPAMGPWSSCENASCSVGMGCLEGETGAAVCTVACAGFDPASCPAAPGDIVAPTCISVGGMGVCALDCSGGLACPAGMACVVDSDDNGAIEVCL